jgi:hypothetical protein
MPTAEGQPGLEEDPEQRAPADRLGRPFRAAGRLLGALAVAVASHGQAFGGRPAPRRAAAPWGSPGGRTTNGRIMSWSSCSSRWQWYM